MKIERFDDKYKLVFDDLSEYRSWSHSIHAWLDGTDDVKLIWDNLRKFDEVLNSKIETHVTETVTGQVYVLVDFDTLSALTLGINDLLAFYG